MDSSQSPEATLPLELDDELELDELLLEDELELEELLLDEELEEELLLDEELEDELLLEEELEDEELLLEELVGAVFPLLEELVDVVVPPHADSAAIAARRIECFIMVLYLNIGFLIVCCRIDLHWLTGWLLQTPRKALRFSSTALQNSC